MQQCRNPRRRKPLHAHSNAEEQAPTTPSREVLDQLQFIRHTMESATSFTAVPGWGTVILGLTALTAAFFARTVDSQVTWVLLWLGEAVLSMSIALVAMQRKAQRAGAPLTSGPGSRFARTFLPPMVAGAILTPVLYNAGLARLLPGTWLLLYGTGVLTGGAFSVPIVPVMGMSFMLTGVAALLLPGWNSLFMALGFGGLHILFGFLIARAMPAHWANGIMAAGFGGLHVVFGLLIARRHGG